MSKKDRDVILWALVCAAYNLEKLDENEAYELKHLRKILSGYSPATVSLYFLRAHLAFNPPETLEQAQAVYEYYGVDSSGLERTFPVSKLQ